MTKEQALRKAKAIDPSAVQFVVRLYDGFDNCWMDVLECDPEFGGRTMNEQEVMDLWAKKTNNGTSNTSYSDIDYYAIYPTTVKMVHSEQGNRDLGIDTIR
jgi:hypothetical protein